VHLNSDLIRKAAFGLYKRGGLWFERPYKGETTVHDEYVIIQIKLSVLNTEELVSLFSFYV